MGLAITIIFLVWDVWSENGARYNILFSFGRMVLKCG